jgi:Domain of Unknown Function with PDB structure (DUF3862)
MKFLKGCLMAVGGLVLFVFIAALFFSKSGNQQSTSSSPSSNASKASSPTAAVTMASYSRLKTGMTYAQVVQILGKDGEELSSSEVGGIKTIMYKWDGDGFGANMNSMFQNNKLMSKSQFGLK